MNPMWPDRYQHIVDLAKERFPGREVTADFILDGKGYGVYRKA